MLMRLDEDSRHRSGFMITITKVAGPCCTSLNPPCCEHLVVSTSLCLLASGVQVHNVHLFLLVLLPEKQSQKNWPASLKQWWQSAHPSSSSTSFTHGASAPMRTFVYAPCSTLPPAARVCRYVFFFSPWSFIICLHA